MLSAVFIRRSEGLRRKAGLVCEACELCGRRLNVDADPLSGDCGGDCWGCIGWIEAQTGGDPEDNISIGFIAKEIAWGWREADGSPKPQSVFIAGSTTAHEPDPQ